MGIDLFKLVPGHLAAARHHVQQPDDKAVGRHAVGVCVNFHRPSPSVVGFAAATVARRGRGIDPRPAREAGHNRYTREAGCFRGMSPFSIAAEFLTACLILGMPLWLPPALSFSLALTGALAGGVAP